MAMIICNRFFSTFTDLQEEGVHLKIIEEPINRIRYRYRSEKGSHGGLNGVNSCPIRKTYPTVKVIIYFIYFLTICTHTSAKWS